MEYEIADRAKENKGKSFCLSASLQDRRAKCKAKKHCPWRKGCLREETNE